MSSRALGGARDIQHEELPPEFQNQEESIKITGFWMFIVTDVLIFAALFATYAVYVSRVATGPTPFQVFDLNTALIETLILLTSSFTIGIAIWAMRQGNDRMVMWWLMLTVALGIAFVSIELTEFAGDVARGWGWHTSAFLSAFFLLVAAHGTHVTMGIIWAVSLIAQLFKRGLTTVTRRKLYTFSIYWHFLDIMWVFIFTVVYLGGRLV
jgi:cytochrome aa3-600 menaquinol oxidase subunit 3